MSLASTSPRSTPRPYVIGIAGGSGSGKTTIARALAEAVGAAGCALIEQDAYYCDHPNLSFEARAALNYDHPDAIELPLLVAHLDALCAGRTIDKPRYDFEQHRRETTFDRVEPRPVVIVEGILVLVDESLRRRFDLKMFVDTASDLRVMRRIRRDLEHRGRTFEQVRRQYYATVRPMHLEFVEPSKRHADIIVPEGGENPVALDLILGRLHEFIRAWPGA